MVARWPGAKFAILNDGSVYGEGLADETRRQLNKNGVTEVLNQDVTPGESDYSPVVAKLRNAGIEVVYFGGYYREAALVIRSAREHGYQVQLVSGDGIASEAFVQVTGDAGEGTLFTSFRDPRRSSAAEPIVARFRQQGFEPEGYTLYSYGAVEAWAQAAAKAGSTESKAVIGALRSGEFNTILGPISFNDKGDVKRPGFEWFVWRGGRYVPLE